ncbi:MAG TPA: phosphoribosyltransferase family protein [Bacteroidia bacterium]|jgi:competence protein ComFC|nr:phosphoribosyltransferase family protein [Bacteroidia bacterium]
MQWLSDLASLIYPRVCNGCGNTLFKHEQAICNLCYVSLPRTNFHMYPDNPVQKIFYGRADVQAAGSFLLFQKKGSVQKMLHALKYKSKPEVGVLLGKWYGQDLKKNNTFCDCDIIIPVPLHKKRMKKRGYNQSEFIAKGLAEELQIPVVNDVLFKKHFTETQTFKSREERWQNTINSFEIKNENLIKDKKILLVDDVITTGATTEACIFQLNKSSEAPISVASIAYTL